MGTTKRNPAGIFPALLCLSLCLAQPAGATDVLQADFQERLGFFSAPEFQRTDGFTSSRAEFLLNSRHLTGWSQRFAGANNLSEVPWAYSLDTGATGRFGLFAGPEFTRADGEQQLTVSFLTQSGLAAGSSQRYSGSTTLGRAAWVADLAGGQTVRAGLFTGSEFTSGSGVQFSQWATNGFTAAGFGHGTSNRYSGLNDRGRAAWAFDAQTGQTHRIGLFSGAEFTSSAGTQISDGRQITNAGWIWGESTRYNSAATSQGLAAWLAHAETGVTSRIGFFTGSEFTSTNGEQISRARFMNSAGFVTGDSERYAGTVVNGFAAWVANPQTGVTTRLGLFTGPEFTRNDGFQVSTASAPTESGWITGTSARYQNLTFQTGSAAWIAHASNGQSTRIGLFTDPIYTSMTGAFQISSADLLNNAGLAAGRSNRYLLDSFVGHAVWVADGNTGVTRRLGLFSAPEFSHQNAWENSALFRLTESGYLAGTSTRYIPNTNTPNGEAVWATQGMSGAIHRLGNFTGSEFTSSSGRQESDILQITETGWVAGRSTRYQPNSTSTAGSSAWIAHADTGVTHRVGFFQGPDFVRSDTMAISFISSISDDGWAYGTSNRFAGANFNGNAVWMANGHTGVTTRLGLFGTQEFQSDTLREQSTIDFQYANGLVLGHSSVYNGLEVAFGGAAWRAHNSDGITRRLGLTDALHTRSDGIRNSEIRGHNEEGFIWGRSSRYDGTSSFRGFTAWIWSPLDEAQFSFSFSSRPSDNFAFSRIDQVFPTGLVVGTYTLFDENSVDQGDHLFLWAPGTEAITLDEAVPQGLDAVGWETFLQSRFLYDGNRLVLSGIPNSGPTASRGVGVFELAIVPEPSTGLLVLVGAGAIFFLRRRNFC